MSKLTLCKIIARLPSIRRLAIRSMPVSRPRNRSGSAETPTCRKALALCYGCPGQCRTKEDASVIEQIASAPTSDIAGPKEWHRPGNRSHRTFPPVSFFPRISLRWDPRAPAHPRIDHAAMLGWLASRCLGDNFRVTATQRQRASCISLTRFWIWPAV